MKDTKIEVKDIVYIKDIPICMHCKEKAAVQSTDILDHNLCMDCLTSELYQTPDDIYPINMIRKDRRLIPRD